MFKSRWVFGVFIIFLGVVFLLNNLNVTDFDLSSIISTYWPIILVLLGLDFLSNRDSKGEFLSGAIIIFLGIVFLGRNTNLFYIDLSFFWRLFWPTIIILAGVSLLLGKRNIGKNNFALMGSIEKNKEPWQLESGSYTALMGGIELDLTVADIPDGETVLDFTAIMGGIEVFVPKDVTVYCQGTVVLGGIELLDRSTGGILSSAKSEQIITSSTKQIKIYCRTIMGGIDLKSR
ncbi:cell wall-active antibiotics response protein [Alkaliphilus pronyensis]|uniref:Cell wall-active antibiotics response protein n=1 Tax=Alkaliphilus pronyensis TaxID=1482732 RepID=A0A6I0F3S0_9FIRM|nr:LiaF domain-containing protein [Alkaliphilus pronyensis]KAB3533819.1 cell wall-active antibiotics response protein [Alkaliphilus pronyensis]